MAVLRGVSALLIYKKPHANTLTVRTWDLMFPFLYLLDLILYGLHGPGVGLAVDILDLLVHQAGVYLGGRDVRVAQHLLDGTQVCPILQQMGGEGMAQGVGRDVLFNTSLLLIVLDELPKALAAHPLPVHVHK